MSKQNWSVHQKAARFQSSKSTGVTVRKASSLSLWLTSGSVCHLHLPRSQIFARRRFATRMQILPLHMPNRLSLKMRLHLPIVWKRRQHPLSSVVLPQIFLQVRLLDQLQKRRRGCSPCESRTKETLMRLVRTLRFLEANSQIHLRRLFVVSVAFLSQILSVRLLVVSVGTLVPTPRF